VPLAIGHAGQRRLRAAFQHDRRATRIERGDIGGIGQHGQRPHAGRIEHCGGAHHQRTVAPLRLAADRQPVAALAVHHFDPRLNHIHEAVFRAKPSNGLKL
jgi:hypothetical protein